MISAALLAAATPSPTSTSTPKVDADLVTPGLGGFLLLFFLALAVYLLGRSMARRVRRVNQRARIEAELAEEAERAGLLEHERLETEPAAAADEDPPPAR